MSNVEMSYVGQSSRLGRHPINFLNGKDMPSSYIRECVVHRSFNRAINIHLTNYLSIENNLIYDIKGSGFVLHDGREIGNILTHNLAVFVRGSASSYNYDLTPGRVFHNYLKYLKTLEIKGI